MNKLQRQTLIKKDFLDVTHYFQSILQEAYKLNLLTDNDLENIQMQSLQILTKETERYTKGESSSVKIEVAQSILQSIFYSIGVYLKSFPDIDLSIKELKEKPLSEFFAEGKNLINIQLESSKQLFSLIQKDNFPTDNLAYIDTTQHGLSDFFLSYNVDFAAHDIPCSIDYPLFKDKMDLLGIEYIYGYLQKLFLENCFCNKFSLQDINCLLLGYNDHHEELLINIFGLVLANALGCILLNKSISQLSLTALDRQRLKQILDIVPKDSLDVVLQDACKQLFVQLKLSNLSLQKYILDTASNLSPILKNALENHALESLFITSKKSLKQPNFQFEDGKNLEDELFRIISNEIRLCRFVADKIAIIKREIHSATDLIDILEGYCIFDSEFTELFKSLGDMELALLYKNLPPEFMEAEKEWQNSLHSFLNQLELPRRAGIKELAEGIEFY